MHTRSAFARTDNPFDMMINGDGFFVAGTARFGPGATANDPDVIVGYDMLYTRSGNFKLDDEGYLVTSDGMYVLGYASDIIFDPGVPPTAAAPDNPVVPASITFSEPGGALTRIRLRLAEDTVFYMDDGTALTPIDQNDVYDTMYDAGIKIPQDLLGFSVGEDGSIGVMLNNKKETVGRLAVAMFSNPGGLEKVGNSFYMETAPSGEAVIDETLNIGGGNIMTGGLEMSNVDLATEFTDMIVTQRGFQANSRIITVSDTMLEELINLKR